MKALNYGAIGAMIGHELTHGYDDQGARFGPSGNFEEWWTKEDAARLKALTGKLVAQYNGYTAATGLTEKVNGNLTLGENIADLGGLNIAYDAFQKAVAGKPDPMTDGMTRDQRFFRLRVELAREVHARAHQDDRRLRPACARWRARQWHA